MRKAIYYKWCINWKLLCVWNVCFLLFLYAIHGRLFELRNHDIVLSIRTCIVVGLLMISFIGLYLVMSYMDYDSGKLRYQLLRKHHHAWLVADVIIVFLQAILLYLAIRIAIWQGLSQTVAIFVESGSEMDQHMLMKAVMFSSPIVRDLMSLSSMQAAYLVATILFVGIWVHTTAIGFLKQKQTIQDWILRGSIGILLLAGMDLYIYLACLICFSLWQLHYATDSWKEDVLEEKRNS